jgi:spore coat protein U-like protein
MHAKIAFGRALGSIDRVFVGGWSMLRRLMLVPAPFLVALAAAAPAIAATDTDQLTVTATVSSSCSLNGGSLNFGQYVTGQTTDLDVTGAINYVNCSGQLSIALDGGASGSISNRQMVSGSGRLSYQIYRNPTRTAIWGTGGDSLGVILTIPQSGSVPVYGRIPRGQSVVDGVYTDTVTITLSF